MVHAYFQMNFGYALENKDLPKWLFIKLTTRKAHNQWVGEWVSGIRYFCT